MSNLELVLIAHNIRSLYNVGSIFRTCDGAGVSQLYLTGYSGFPPRKEISKTALGAEASVAWEHHWEITPVLNQLKEDGFTIAAIERHAQSIAYTDFAPPAKLALILGNEVTGIESPELQQSDITLYIPMHGIKESLNVSVCAGIILYGIRSQWQSQNLLDSLMSKAALNSK